MAGREEVGLPMGHPGDRCAHGGRSGPAAGGHRAAAYRLPDIAHPPAEHHHGAHVGARTVECI